MSILNLTPDSFSDGGAHHPLTTPASLAALARAVGAHAAHGAAVLDLGAESTRPGAAAVAPDEEWARLAPALDVARAGLAARPWCALSVDTRRGRVAAAALARGARVVNDVQGGADAALLAAAARARAGLVLGHTRGAPADMLRAPHAEYPGAGAGGVVEAVARELAVAVRRAMGAGVRRWRVAVDPGIGFAKRPAQSAEVMRGLGALREAHGLCGLPLVVGVSRKSVLRRMVMRDGEAVDADEDGRRRILAASVAGTVAAVQMGADVVRVHDVLENVAAARVADALYRGTPVVD
jgi:2-amino-4-hydroxy-6-hydroxymethyldihydropteridine diphosphokinase/dihydropteroate synthase